MAHHRLIVRIAAAGAAVSAFLVLGAHGAGAAPPWGAGTNPDDHGLVPPSPVCGAAGSSTRDLHTCPPAGESGGQPQPSPVPGTPPLTVSPPSRAIRVPALGVTLTALPAVAPPSPAAAPAPPAPVANAPSGSPPSPASRGIVPPPPPLVLLLPTAPLVSAGAAAPAALVGVVAPAAGVAGACILVGALGFAVLVRRPVGR